MSVSNNFLIVFVVLIMLLQYILRRVVGIVSIIISPSNISPSMPLPEICHQKCQAVLAAVSAN